jgi:hypothetical protein
VVLVRHLIVRGFVEAINLPSCKFKGQLALKEHARQHHVKAEHTSSSYINQ